jgi:hypothetical protein
MSRRPASPDDDEYASARSGSVNALERYHDETAFEPEMTRESKRLASDARIEQASMGDPTRQLTLYLDNHMQRNIDGYDALKILGLLESGADPVAYRGRDGDTILHSISKWRTSSYLVEILDRIVFICRDLINTPNALGISPTFRACEWSMYNTDYDDHRIAILNILIKYGANINATNGRGISHLCVAISEMNRIMFDFCLANGADPNYGGSGSRPIECAVIRRDPYMVSRLLELKVDLDFIPKESQQTMLQVGINHPDRIIQMCFVNWRLNAARGVVGVHDDFRRLSLKSRGVGGIWPH